MNGYEGTGRQKWYKLEKRAIVGGSGCKRYKQVQAGIMSKNGKSLVLALTSI